ncbi:MAG TPA: VWA domain-containing protein [Candidatus Sulfotelmatobacter sp.]|nr:VWA domain-containing protein [Candidatus Sulfotelmatobacter sp.]
MSVFPFVFFARGSDDAPVATYRNSAAEVRISFFATDEHNHTVEILQQSDFAVVDGGMVVRNFRSLARAAETQLGVVAVMDASESVKPRFQASVNDVLQLVSERPPDKDANFSGVSFSIVSFSGLRPELLCADNCRSQMAGQRLVAVQAAGATPLFDALVYAARFASSRQTPGVRQVLILFSDGNDTISRASAREALEAVIASGALLYTVDMNQPGQDPKASAALQQMAEATGGRAFSAASGAASMLQAVLADLRASYVVTYQLPSRMAGFHSLRILPQHNLNLRFHSRSGYYYEKSIP